MSTQAAGERSIPHHLNVPGSLQSPLLPRGRRSGPARLYGGSRGMIRWSPSWLSTWSGFPGSRSTSHSKS